MPPLASNFKDNNRRCLKGKETRTKTNVDVSRDDSHITIYLISPLYTSNYSTQNKYFSLLKPQTLLRFPTLPFLRPNLLINRTAGALPHPSRQTDYLPTVYLPLLSLTPELVHFHLGKTPFSINQCTGDRGYVQVLWECQGVGRGAPPCGSDTRDAPPHRQLSLPPPAPPLCGTVALPVCGLPHPHMPHPKSCQGVIPWSCVSSDNPLEG